MVKKSLAHVVFFITLFSFSVSALLCEERTLTIKLGVHYFQPSEQSTKDIYGGRAVIGGEVNLKVWRFIDLWLAGSYYTKRGNLPFTEEATRLTLIPVGGGPKIIFKSGIINPYVAFGPVIYVSPTPLIVMTGFLFGLLATVIVAFLPIGRVARLEPAEALRTV